jgi:hypothetical protein
MKTTTQAARLLAAAAMTGAAMVATTLIVVSPASAAAPSSVSMDECRQGGGTVKGRQSGPIGFPRLFCSGGSHDGQRVRFR